MIDGVVITPLKRIPDERGSVMHMLRCDWPVFQSFGEIYFSTVHPGVVKGWHLHHRMVLNYAVPIGRIKFVLYDDRAESPTKGEAQEIFLGEDNYQLVTVPAMIWNGFKGIGDETALVANCASIPHDPTEIERMDPFNPAIPYDWDVKHG
jgi:dTDP-4-dehydrorhamnose 3,5-epimerase